jgi:phosphomannomutase
VPALINRADNTRRATEDSPARIVIAFDGDGSKLPLEERIFADQFRMFTKQEFPYALLMYIWENRAPVGTVIENLHTSRIRMIVADSGDANLGQWRQQTRNVYEDFRRAFGEEPTRIKSVGIMTDSDNTGEEAEAYYGDITFMRRRP